MGIALVIVGGLVLMTLAASLFGYLGEKKKRLDPDLQKKIEAIEQRLSSLEAGSGRADERIEQVEGDVAFVNKLLSDRTK
ncbi:MAG TPA: hypothetical protein VMW69_00325 [Spirochaetia bacterium]|nr:hypothetical protein [Spirochaetia bacterium]